MKNQIKEYQMFMLNDEMYGIEIEKVIEVCGMEEFAKGLVNHKNEDLPLIDLRRELDIIEKDYDEKTAVITVEVENYGVVGSCGIIVDTAKGVWDINENEICEPLPYGTFIERERLSGMGIVNDEVVTLLNVDKIMPHDQIGRLKDLRVNTVKDMQTEKTNIFDQQWFSIAESLWTSNTPVLLESMIG